MDLQRLLSLKSFTPYREATYINNFTINDPITCKIYSCADSHYIIFVRYNLKITMFIIVNTEKNSHTEWLFISITCIQTTFHTNLIIAMKRKNVYFEQKPCIKFKKNVRLCLQRSIPT